MKEKIMGTLSAGMAGMKKGMQDSVDSCKLEGKISEQKKQIKRLTKEIGNLAIVRLEAGDEMCPEIMERFEAIKEAQAEIECLEKGRKIVKIVCPGCGAKTSAKMNYCGKCGTVLRVIEDEMETVETVEAAEDLKGEEV